MVAVDFNLCAAFLYALASCAAWWSATPSDGVPRRPHIPAAVVRTMLWLAILVHFGTLVATLFAGETLNLGFAPAVSLILWLTTVSYVVVGSDVRLTRLATLYLVPLTALGAALPTFVSASRVVLHGGWAFRLHIAVAFAAYALFTVAALHALLMLSLERRLHDGMLLTGQDSLPSLLRIERLLFRLLSVAFVLLTLTVVSGIFFSEAVFERAFTVTHKSVFAVLSWFIFGGLLLGHWLRGWRGKVAIRWTLIGFGSLLLAYLGSKFVLEIVLKRF